MRNKVAVVVHVFYPEIWPDISSRLLAIKYEYDLYITTTHGLSDEVRRLIIADFPAARFRPFDNLGMDIVPFLLLVPELLREGYLAVCKLHTKKGQGLQGDEWRRVALDCLIGSTRIFDKVVNAFENDRNLSIAGPSCLYTWGGVFLEKNITNIEKISLSLYGSRLPCNKWGYFMGTMFWARPSDLLEMSRFAKNNVLDLNQTYQSDGKLEHAYERFFGLIPVYLSKTVGLMIRDGTCAKSSELVVIKPYSWAPYTLDFAEKFLSFRHQYEVISESGIFDAEYYRRQIDFPLLKFDPIAHYLLEGGDAGLRPRSGFNPLVYGVNNPDCESADGIDGFVRFIEKESALAAQLKSINNRPFIDLYLLGRLLKKFARVLVGEWLIILRRSRAAWRESHLTELR